MDTPQTTDQLKRGLTNRHIQLIALGGARFKSWGYPVTNVICLLFLAGILAIMAITPGIQISVWLIPVWLVAMAVVYWVKNRNRTPADIVVSDV